MNTSHTDRSAIRALFESALDIEPGERNEWLAFHCPDPADRAEVERLLLADSSRPGHVVDQTFDRVLDAVGEASSGAPPAGTRVGAFTLHEQLGEGGSSIVFRASREQDGVKQYVALKLLRRNLYTDDERRRFRDERRALSQLQHPGIARLIEGGLTEAGSPYIALDLIEGESIVEHARSRTLDLPQRLRLFVDVCRAVEAAHRALIVHRDLKPSNVMVTPSGEVKLLDFGIAKLLDTADADGTQTHHAPMTPAYAAPEQFLRGQITTATDVYSLGVLLGELITGHRHEQGDSRTPSAQVDDTAAAQAQMANARAMRRQLRGDLDNIVLKATAEEPERRYASAGAFADDIERHLLGEPVIAHPPSQLYRARKFVGRHRGGVITTTLFVLALFALLGLTLWQAHAARQEALRANTVRDFVVGLFDTARAHMPRDQRPTPEALVEQAQRNLAQPTKLDAVTQADLLRTLGEVSLSLSNFSQAESLFGQAQILAQTAGDEDASRNAQVLRADAMQRAGHAAEAVAALNPVLVELGATPSVTLLRAYAVMAAAEMDLGKPDAAIAHRRDEVRIARNVYGADSTDALAAAFEIGSALVEANRFPEAITTLAPLLVKWHDLHAPEDDRYVDALSNLAIANDGVGDLAAGEARFRELLALKKRIYTPPHDAIARSMQDLAAILQREERYPEAETLLNEALAMQRQVFGEDHREIAVTYDTLGGLMDRQRRFPEANANYLAAIGVCERTHIKQEVCTRARNNLGMSFYRQGRLDEAKHEMSQALAERRALFGNDDPTIAYSLSTLSNVAVKQNDFELATRLCAEALDILHRNGRDATREAALTRNSYAQALFKAGRNDEALREIDQSLTDWQRVEPEGKARHVMMLVLKAQILTNLNRPADVKAAVEQAIALKAQPSDLPAATRQLLRTLSGDSTLYPDPGPETPTHR
ncbi:MAG: serine/threonine-protein kinase [Dokdonella sp.]